MSIKEMNIKNVFLTILIVCMFTMNVHAAEQTAEATVIYTCEDSFFIEIPQTIYVGEENYINAVEVNIAQGKKICVDLMMNPNEYVTLTNGSEEIDVYFRDSDGNDLTVSNMTIAEFPSGSQNSQKTFTTYVGDTTGKTAGEYTGTAMFYIYCQ